MTTEPKCLPECFGYEDHPTHFRAPGCPKAEAPKVKQGLPMSECGQPTPASAPEPKWDNTTVCFGSDCPNCEREKASPEPKQGSEEPIDWESADEWADDWNQFSPVAQADKYILSEVGWNARRAYLALRAEVERLKEAISGSNGEGRAILTVNVIRHWSDESKAALVEKISDYSALRADLATAREEIAKLRKFVSEAMHEADAEKARADRAEERVKELEDQDLQVLETDDTSIDLIGFWRNARARARAILAARARKEGASR